MSPSARRLSGAMVTDRFGWQRNAAVDTPVVPLFGPQATAAGVTPALRDLPSPAADRLAAAERDAYAKGYADGERAGEREASARVDVMLERLTATIDEIAALRQGIIHRAERDLVRLALAMAERIVRREIDMDRELLVVMARVAVDRLGETTAAAVHLNPADHQAATIGGALPPGGAVQLIADPAIPRGGCLVKSSFGTIDAGIDSQVRELSRALLGDEGRHEDPAHGVPTGL